MADGVATTPDVLTSRRLQVDIEYDPREAQLTGQQLAGKLARNVPWLQATFFRTDRAGLSGRCESQSIALDAAEHAALLAAEHAVSDSLKRQ
jgi:dienelactone hydrolase